MQPIQPITIVPSTEELYCLKSNCAARRLLTIVFDKDKPKHVVGYWLSYVSD